MADENDTLRAQATLDTRQLEASLDRIERSFADAAKNIDAGLRKVGAAVQNLNTAFGGLASSMAQAQTRMGSAANQASQAQTRANNAIIGSLSTLTKQQAQATTQIVQGNQQVSAAIGAAAAQHNAATQAMTANMATMARQTTTAVTAMTAALNRLGAAQQRQRGQQQQTNQSTITAIQGLAQQAGQVASTVSNVASAMGAGGGKLAAQIAVASQATGGLVAAFRALGPAGAVGATAIAGVGSAIVALIGYAKQTAATAREIKNMSDIIGFSTDTMQSFNLTMARGGFGVDSLAEVVTKFGVRASEAMLASGEGTNELTRQFDSLGISATKFIGLNPEEKIKQFSDAVARLTDTTGAYRTMQRIVDDELTKKFLPLLRRGSDELERQQRMTRALGAVMSKDLIDKLDDLDEQFKTLGVGLQGLGYMILDYFADPLVTALETINSGLLKMQQLMRSVSNQEPSADVAGAQRDIAQARLARMQRIQERAQKDPEYLKKVAYDAGGVLAGLGIGGDKESFLKNLRDRIEEARGEVRRLDDEYKKLQERDAKAKPGITHTTNLADRLAEDRKALEKERDAVKQIIENLQREVQLIREKSGLPEDRLNALPGFADKIKKIEEYQGKLGELQAQINETTRKLDEEKKNAPTVPVPNIAEVDNAIRQRQLEVEKLERLVEDARKKQATMPGPEADKFQREQIDGLQKQIAEFKKQIEELTNARYVVVVEGQFKANTGTVPPYQGQMPDERERRLAAAMVVAEGGGKDPQHATLIAQVMRNRMEDNLPGFGGNTLAGVVKAPGQFSPWANVGKSEAALMEFAKRTEQFAVALEAVNAVFEGRAADLAKGSRYFSNIQTVAAQPGGVSRHGHSQPGRPGIVVGAAPYQHTFTRTAGGRGSEAADREFEDNLRAGGYQPVASGSNRYMLPQQAAGAPATAPQRYSVPPAVIPPMPAQFNTNYLATLQSQLKIVEQVVRESNAALRTMEAITPRQKAEAELSATPLIEKYGEGVQEALGGPIKVPLELLMPSVEDQKAIREEIERNIKPDMTPEQVEEVIRQASMTAGTGRYSEAMRTRTSPLHTAEGERLRLPDNRVVPTPFELREQLLQPRQQYHQAVIDTPVKAETRRAVAEVDVMKRMVEAIRNAGDAAAEVNDRLEIMTELAGQGINPLVEMERVESELAKRVQERVIESAKQIGINDKVIGDLARETTAIQKSQTAQADFNQELQIEKALRESGLQKGSDAYYNRELSERARLLAEINRQMAPIVADLEKETTEVRKRTAAYAEGWQAVEKLNKEIMFQKQFGHLGTAGDTDANRKKVSDYADAVKAEEIGKKSPFAQLRNETINLSHTVENTLITAFTSLGDVIGDVVATGKLDLQSLGQIGQQVVKMLISELIKMAMVKAATSLFGGGFSGGGPINLGNGGGSAPMIPMSASVPSLGGIYAVGGRPPPGKVSLVGELGKEVFIPEQLMRKDKIRIIDEKSKPIILGENGPEMIHPKVAGYIVPNNQLVSKGLANLSNGVTSAQGATDANSKTSIRSAGRPIDGGTRRDGTPMQRDATAVRRTIRPGDQLGILPQRAGSQQSPRDLPRNVLKLNPNISNKIVLPRADGGPVLKDHPYLVGEKRPELFIPDRAGRIEKDVGGQSAAAPQHIEIHTTINADAKSTSSMENVALLAQTVEKSTRLIVKEELSKAQRSGGGSNVYSRRQVG